MFGITFLFGTPPVVNGEAKSQSSMSSNTLPAPVACAPFNKRGQ